MQTELRVKEGRYLRKLPVTLRIEPDRIWFDSMPFSKALNAEIKAMDRYKWHGFEDPPVKKWSIANSPRNVFQLRCLMGENPYEWFDRDIQSIEYERPLAPQQIDMINRCMTYHYQILAAEQGLGKSLVAIEVAERSSFDEAWYVGPKSALASFKRECKKWKCQARFETMTYEGLVSLLKYDRDEVEYPGIVIFDESDNVKSPEAQRTQEAQYLADRIREIHGFEGYVIELSGTPSAKHPTDLWSQCEIAWPGYLREGNHRAFELRYAVTEECEFEPGVKFKKRTGWKEAEVAKLPQRYTGLMTVYRKKDWLDLPDKKYRKIRLEPSKKVLRVGKMLCDIAKNTIAGLGMLRALSSGFQYSMEEAGEEDCPSCNGSGQMEQVWDATDDHMPCLGCEGSGKIKTLKRVANQVETPKEDALRELLDEHDAHGRLVIAAHYQGTIDRILTILKDRGWMVACVDGRGWRSYDAMGKQIDTDPLDMWDEHHGKVAFLGNPGSARYGLTLTAANTIVFYENDFSAGKRLQMEDRIHRMGMDLVAGATIVDLIHLPVDQLVIDTLKSNKKLEHLSLGVVAEALGLDEEGVDQ